MLPAVGAPVDLRFLGAIADGLVVEVPKGKGGGQLRVTEARGEAIVDLTPRE